jgi:phage terminase small subunit
VNARQQRFCEEYLIDLNATQAAIRAGYSSASAGELGCALLKNVKVRARIDAELAERSRRTGVTADRVVRELARVAFADITDVVDVDRATLRPNADRDDTAVIASVKVKEGDDFTEREIKMCDKLRALELLGKHMGMFTDKVALVDDRPVIMDDVDGVARG